MARYSSCAWRARTGARARSLLAGPTEPRLLLVGGRREDRVDGVRDAQRLVQLDDRVGLATDPRRHRLEHHLVGIGGGEALRPAVDVEFRDLIARHERRVTNLKTALCPIHDDRLAVPARQGDPPLASAGP